MSNPSRDNRFDNLKGILIFLVVLAHALDLFGGTAISVPRGIIAVILSFHMPAFVFVSGYFSKSAAGSGRQTAKLVKTILIPFLIAHLLKWVTGTRTVESLFYPTWTLWYLLSLFFWRIPAVPFSKLRFPVAVTLALALVTGFTSADQMLSLSRTICFFPLFMMGYLTGAEELDRLRRINKAVPAFLFLAMAALVLLLGRRVPVIAISGMEGPYREIGGITALQGMGLRLNAILVGMIMTHCLICLAPQKKTLLAALGTSTMTVYLGHSFFLSAAEKLMSIAHITIPASGQGILVVLFSLALTAIACVLFGNRWVVSAYNKALNWIAKQLMRDEQTSA